MIIPVNWLKKYTDISLPIDDLAERIGARLVEIEDVISLAEKYKDVVVVKVVECSQVEESDHLNVTKIDDDGVVKDVERDENGLVQVVCGAPNVSKGMLAAWLPPRSTVPETFGSPEPFVLSAKNLRGLMSNGMLASAKELDLFDDHTGIVAIDKDVKPGTSFAQVYELDDYLLDIENKSLTHRPDTFGIIGFAREVAAITGSSFVTPEWLANEHPALDKSDDESLKITTFIDDPSLSARYQAVVMSDADASRQSPFEIQTYLSRVGVRPINAVVDVTNYLMMLTGQPLHAFDYDKVIAVSGGKSEIHVRAGKKAEKLELLDGRVVELTPEDIVIAAGDVAIGLAGAMGGANTVIDESTKNIIIESATFDLYRLRATQMRHGIFSEAITRFTKGQPAELTAPVLAEAIELMQEWAQARRVSKVSEALGTKVERSAITVRVDDVNDLLGTKLNITDIEKTLESTEFACAKTDATTLSVGAPYWRADIHIVEDIIEEVGRIRGYDEISQTLPTRQFVAVSPSAFDDMRQLLRRVLVRGGANEVLSYSFVHGDVLKKAGQDPLNSYQISNSISPDLQYYRQTLTPSLLNVVHANIKQGYDEFALFEMNKTHQKSYGLTDEGVPKEIEVLAFTVANKKKQQGAPYYQAKTFLDFVFAMLEIQVDYHAIDTDPAQPESAPFEYRRSAFVIDRKSGDFIGIIGEYKKSVVKAFKLPEHSAGFELNTEAVLAVMKKREKTYTPLSRYQYTERDICFQVGPDILYAQIINAIRSFTDEHLQVEISPVDIYQAADEQTKNITVRIRLIPTDHTLTSDEIASIIGTVTTSVITATKAAVI